MTPGRFWTACQPVLRARRGFELCVVETDPDVFAQLVDAPGAVTIRDIGYTEVAPNTATVVASPRPLAH